MNHIDVMRNPITRMDETFIRPGARVKIARIGQEDHHLFEIIVNPGGSLEVRAVYAGDRNGHMGCIIIHPSVSNVITVKSVSL
jgi:hypothetical protein